MAGVTVDLSARKEVDALLLASEERMRLLLDSASDYAIFSTDPAGRIQSWNSGAERIIGYAAEEAVGLHARLIFTPEDRERGADVEEMETARATGRALDERWHLRKDGSQDRPGAQGQRHAQTRHDRPHRHRPLRHAPGLA